MYASISDAAAPYRKPECQASWISAQTLPDPVAISFGRFVALPRTRALFEEGAPVSVGGRAFDLLMVLLHGRGEVVSKEKIVRYVWPTTTVDESNLRFQMAVLRKVLGRDGDVIKTVHGRGYLFAGKIRIEVADNIVPDTCDGDCVPHPNAATSDKEDHAGNCDSSIEERRLTLNALCDLLRLLHVDAEALSLARRMLADAPVRVPRG